MAYCTNAEVTADFKAITFGAPPAFISTANVDAFILEADALINSYVGQRWVTPVTGDTDSLNLMKLLSRTIVADRIRGILANKQQTNTDANAQVRSDGFSVKNVMQALNDIRLGNMQLSGATLLLQSAGFFSHNQDRDTKRRFHKDRKQW